MRYRKGLGIADTLGISAFDAFTASSHQQSAPSPPQGVSEVHTKSEKEEAAFFSVGDWTVRPAQRVLERGTERIVLEPKLMDVLAYLAKTAGDVVSAEQLLVDCWHGTFYGDNPVHKTIALLRKALGDDAKVPRYIATVRKRGYQVIAAVAFADERVRGSPPPRSWTQGSPFRGLLPFDMQHSVLFFGRSRATSELLAALREQRSKGCAFVLVTGPSGCGKSSLVHAGVMPALLREAGSGGLRAIASASFMARQQGMTPHEALASAMTRWEVRGRPIFLETERKSLAHTLQRDMANVLQRIAHAISRDGERQDEDALLLVVETLEALVTAPALAPAESAAFVSALAQLAQSGDVVVVALCRNDFYPSLMEIPELLTLKRGGGLYDVAMPAEGEIAQMIRLPAMAAGLLFERDAVSERQLDDLLLETACRQPGVLPLLQYTLQALYELRENDRLLTFSAYRQLGGLEGALARQAELTFAQLEAGADEAFSSILQRLVAVNSDGEEVTACAARWRDLADDMQRRVVQHLVDAHLLVSLLEEDEPCFTVAHEALLRHWPRVVDWVASHRAMLRSRARISEMTRRWSTEGRRHEHLLPKGLLLADARMLYRHASPPLTGDQCAFVRKSLRRARMRTTLFVSLYALILMLAAFSSVATVVARRAEARAMQRQADAENLIDFMLGDLHERLDALGRLDVLDAVTEQALKVLSHGWREANSDVVLREARALREVGEIRFTRADLVSAQHAFDAAQADLRTLLARKQQVPAVYDELGKLAFWRGQIASTRGNNDEAHQAWLAYLADAQQRAALEPDEPDAWLELSYANNCLGTYATRTDHLDEAIVRFQQSAGLKQRYLSVRTSDGKIRLELADTMSWLALAQQQRGQLKQALESFQAERQTVAAAGTTGDKGAPSNLWLYRRALATLHIAKAEADLGQATDAAQEYAVAASSFAELVDAVPDNRSWQRDLAYAHMPEGWLAYGMNNPELAYRQLLEAEIEAQALLVVNPQNTDWRAFLALDQNYLSVVLLKRGDADKASAVLAEAQRYLSTQSSAKTNVVEEVLRAIIEVTAGEVASARGAPSADRYWHDVVDALAPRAANTNDPRVLDPYIRALLLLGRRKEVDPYLQRLNRAGYHPPMFEAYLKLNPINAHYAGNRNP
jgi:eukaryotic-like serine/threonine-protein kinase